MFSASASVADVPDDCAGYRNKAFTKNTQQLFHIVRRGQNETRTLAAGDYGNIVVKQKGALIFSGGIYNLRDLGAGQQTELLFAAPSELRIEEKFASDQKSTIGPQPGSGIDASDIIFYGNGINGNNGNLGADPKAAKVGPKGTVMANFYAPNGTLWISQGSEVTGAFIARDVIIGENVDVTMGSAFNSSIAKPSGPQALGGQFVAPEMPEEFGLMQNYPNPFNPTTTIQYALPRDARVTLEGYDVLGRRVAELVNGQVGAGYHDASFDGSSLASGIYFYRFNADDGSGKTFTQTRKLMLMK